MTRGRWSRGRSSIFLVISYTEVFAGKSDGERNLVQPAVRVKKINRRLSVPPRRSPAVDLGVFSGPLIHHPSNVVLDLDARVAIGTLIATLESLIR